MIKRTLVHSKRGSSFSLYQVLSYELWVIWYKIYTPTYLFYRSSFLTFLWLFGMKQKPTDRYHRETNVMPALDWETQKNICFFPFKLGASNLFCPQNPEHLEYLVRAGWLFSLATKTRISRCPSPNLKKPGLVESSFTELAEYVQLQKSVQKIVCENASSPEVASLQEKCV